MKPHRRVERRGARSSPVTVCISEIAPVRGSFPNLSRPATLAYCPSVSRFPARSGRIIVANSNAHERRELRRALEAEGYQVSEAETAAEAVRKTWSDEHLALILDSQLDGTEPHELCRSARLKSNLGIIVVAGDDTTQGRIDALNAGADDYLPSPFAIRELLARVRAVLRRVSRSDDGAHQIMLHDRAIDLKSYEVRGPGRQVSHLTPKEFLVLQCLLTRVNKAFTHQYLAQSVWQRDGQGGLEYVRIVIRQLRQKLEPDPGNPRYILTERSVGYRFQMPLEPETPARVSNR